MARTQASRKTRLGSRRPRRKSSAQAGSKPRRPFPRWWRATEPEEGSCPCYCTSDPLLQNLTSARRTVPPKESTREDQKRNCDDSRFVGSELDVTRPQRRSFMLKPKPECTCYQGHCPNTRQQSSCKSPHQSHPRRCPSWPTSEGCFNSWRPGNHDCGVNPASTLVTAVAHRKSPGRMPRISAFV